MADEPIGLLYGTVITFEERTFDPPPVSTPPPSVSAEPLYQPPDQEPKIPPENSEPAPEATP